jgi:membrane fusion protein (multidrug efflux system)
MPAPPASRRKRVIRYVLVGVGLLLVLAVLVGVKSTQIRTLMGVGKQMAAAGPPPESVGSATAQEQAWETTVAAVGSVSGLKSVVLGTESPGIVTRLHFESGALVEEGQVLIELDTSVERAQLASARVRRDFAVVTANRSRLLASRNAITQSQLDNDVAQLESASTDLAALRAQVQRRIVRAPFTGRAGIRQVKVGQYLAPGTTVTSLDAVGAVYVDFTLPQERQAAIQVGMPIRVTEREGPAAGTETGTITAIEPTLDEVTRSIKIRATVPHASASLRPGMFVNVVVVLPKRDKVVTVPATAVIHAPYGDSIFAIEDKPPGSPGMATTPDGRPVRIARQHFVRLGQARGDFVAVAEGVRPGQVVVSEGAFKLRNGAPVVIDDKVKAKPQLNPTPPNR